MNINGLANKLHFILPSDIVEQVLKMNISLRELLSGTLVDDCEPTVIVNHAGGCVHDALEE